MAPCSLKLVKNLQLADHLKLTTVGTENERVTGAGFLPLLDQLPRGVQDDSRVLGEGGRAKPCTVFRRGVSTCLEEFPLWFNVVISPVWRVAPVPPRWSSWTSRMTPRLR